MTTPAGQKAKRCKINKKSAEELFTKYGYRTRPGGHRELKFSNRKLELRGTLNFAVGSIEIHGSDQRLRRSANGVNARTLDTILQQFQQEHGTTWLDLAEKDSWSEDMHVSSSANSSPDDSKVNVDIDKTAGFVYVKQKTEERQRTHFVGAQQLSHGNLTIISAKSTPRHKAINHGTRWSPPKHFGDAKADEPRNSIANCLQSLNTLNLDSNSNSNSNSKRSRHKPPTRRSDSDSESNSNSNSNQMAQMLHSKYSDDFEHSTLTVLRKYKPPAEAKRLSLFRHRNFDGSPRANFLLMQKNLFNTTVNVVPRFDSSAVAVMFSLQDLYNCPTGVVDDRYPRHVMMMSHPRALYLLEFDPNIQFQGRMPPFNKMYLDVSIMNVAVEPVLDESKLFNRRNLGNGSTIDVVNNAKSIMFLPAGQWFEKRLTNYNGFTGEQRLRMKIYTSNPKTVGKTFAVGGCYDIEAVEHQMVTKCIDKLNYKYGMHSDGVLVCWLRDNDHRTRRQGLICPYSLKTLACPNASALLLTNDESRFKILTKSNNIHTTDKSAAEINFHEHEVVYLSHSLFWYAPLRNSVYKKQYHYAFFIQLGNEQIRTVIQERYRNGTFGHSRSKISDPRLNQPRNAEEYD